MKMKKLVSIFLLALLLSACSNKNDKEDGEKNLHDSSSAIDVVAEDTMNNLDVIEDNTGVTSDNNYNLDEDAKEDLNTTSDEKKDLDSVSNEKEDLKTVSNEKEDTYNYTKEEMIQFLCYNNGDYSNWYESDYVLVFQKDGIFSCYDASAGNPWLLQYGDTVEGNASYSVDTKNNQIVVKDYDKDIIMNYTIVSNNEIEVKIEGIDEIFHFSKRN